MPTARDVERLFSQVSSYAAFCFAPDGTVLTWNPGVQVILGYGRDQFVGAPVAMLFTEEDRRANVCEREMMTARETGEASDDRWHLRHDGSRRFVAGMVTVVTDESARGDCFLKVLRDRTDYVESSTRLRERGDRAEAATREHEVNMAMIAHELRQPLNAIVGWASIGARSQPPDEAAAEIFRRILKSAESTVRFVEDLLDLSRIAAGKLELVIHPTHLATVVHDTAAELRPETESRQLTLSVDTSDCIVAGDPVRLRQVVRNLLGNALKYTDPGGSIRVLVQCRGNEGVLTVSDTGAGIPPRDLPHIFDRFRQSDHSADGKLGLGLGLWLVKEIVQRHRGVVHAASDGPGRGATFTVRLPRLASRITQD